MLALYLDHVCAHGFELSARLASGARVCELGAGCGVAGMAFALRGAAVTFTDVVPSVLERLEQNVRANLPDEAVASARFREFRWGGENPTACGLAPPYDIVVAADCVYEKAAVASITHALLSLADERSTIVICNERRDREQWLALRTELQRICCRVCELPAWRLRRVSAAAPQVARSARYLSILECQLKPAARVTPTPHRPLWPVEIMAAATARLCGGALLREAAAELRAHGCWRCAEAMWVQVPPVRRALRRCAVPPPPPLQPRERVCSAGIGAAVDAAVPAAEPWLLGEGLLVALARAGLEACVLCALRFGATHADIDAAGHDGETALHCAARAGLERLVKELLRRGCRVDVAGRDSRPLSHAATPGGRTALHMAVAARHRAIVALLLERGASPEAIDWDGVTAHRLARRLGMRLAAPLGGAEAGKEAVVGVDEIAGSSDDDADEGGVGGDGGDGGDGGGGGGGGGCHCTMTKVRQRTRARLSLVGRPLLREPFVLEALFTPAHCEWLLSCASATAARHGWQRHRHPFHPTTDIPASDVTPACYAWLRALLDRNVLPAMCRRYETAQLWVHEAFIVKYEAANAAAGAEAGDDNGDGEDARRAGLGFHRDGTLLSCVVLLNEPSDFEGGGTIFAPSDDGGAARTYRPARGDCLCASGQVRHGAVPVTRGVRYVLVAFVEECWAPT